jgi:hypothetical protein
MYMNPEILFKKLQQILEFIEKEANSPLDNHNHDTRMWSKGYRKAMTTIRDLIWNALNKDNL